MFYLFFRKIRALLFGAKVIAVGHGQTNDGAAVMLFVGRKMVALSPQGARKLADQLCTWADHADASEKTMSVMRYIINFTLNRKTDEEAAATKWVSSGLEKSAQDLDVSAAP